VRLTCEAAEVRRCQRHRCCHGRATAAAMTSGCLRLLRQLSACLQALSGTACLQSSGGAGGLLICSDLIDRGDGPAWKLPGCLRLQGHFTRRSCYSSCCWAILSRSNDALQAQLLLCWLWLPIAEGFACWLPSAACTACCSCACSWQLALIMSIMWWCWSSQGLTINSSFTLYDLSSLTGCWAGNWPGADANDVKHIWCQVMHS